MREERKVDRIIVYKPEEFARILPHVDRQYRLLAKVAFLTDARQGELFGPAVAGH